jgi:hypothetical protein
VESLILESIKVIEILKVCGVKVCKSQPSGKLCLSKQGSEFYLVRCENFREMELWKTIDWNALVKVSDISHVYGIHEKCNVAEQDKYVRKSKLSWKEIDKEAEVTYVLYSSNFVTNYVHY